MYPELRGLRPRLGGSLLHAGDRIGEWVVDAQIGEGGMGAVFRCHNVLSARVQAAVKVLKPHDLGGARERFVHEVELLAAIRHPAVVKVLGGGEDPARGLLYMVMELIEGESLAARLARGPLEWAEACRLFEPLGEGLLEAHRLGVVHRDIKPENILIDAQGRPRLLDFGVAVQEGAARHTQAGAVPGTLAYMAPEVFEGQQPDQRADIYALGQVLWESLTGRVAFEAGGGASFARVVGAKLSAAALDPGPAAPPPVRELVQRCTDPSPDTRLNDLGAFVTTLRTSGAVPVPPAPGSSGPKPASARSPQGLSRGWWVAGLLVALCAGLPTLGVAILLALRELNTRVDALVGPDRGLGPDRSGALGAAMVRTPLPRDFPLTLPEDAELTFSNRSESDGRTSWTVMFTTGEPTQALLAQCRRVLKGRGMTINDNHTSNSATGDTWSLSGYTLAGEVLTVSITAAPAGTQVLYFWSPVP